MRRRSILWLLAIPLLSGCTIAFEEGWQDSMRIFEFGCAKPKPTTVAQCDAPWE